MNKKLSIVALVLLVLAVLTYRHDAGRADRFETGQKFLQNLNPDEISKIKIAGSGEDAAVTLERQGTEYVIAERNGYVARTEEVNRVVRDLLDVGLDRKMGEGGDLEAELGFTGDEAVTVTLVNVNGDAMVSLAVGAAAEDGSRYVKRTSGEDQAVYRTETGFSVSSDPNSFLQKEIVDHSSAEVVGIEGPDYQLAKEKDEDGNWQGSLVLNGADAKASEVNRLSALLSRLSFEEVFLASAPAVADLRFDRSHVFNLDDQSGYQIESAQRGEDWFIRIRGLFNVDRLEVSQDETDEQLEEKADVLRRSDEIANFDQYQGSWIYKLSSTDGEKLGLTRADLVE